MQTNAVSKIEEQIDPLTPKTPWTHEIMMARLSREKPFVIVTMVQPCDPVLVQRVTHKKLVVLEMRLKGEDLNGMVRFAGVLRDGLNTQTKTGSIIANGGIKRFHIKVPLYATTQPISTFIYICFLERPVGQEEGTMVQPSPEHSA